MTATLIYETDDSEFADAVVDELQRAGIDSYRTGGRLGLPGGSTSTVCLYIRNPGDFQRANEILVQQGAAVDAPSGNSLGLILMIAGAGAVLVTLIVLGWK